jgi:hypothetical protein
VAVHGVDEAVARRMGDELARLAGYLAIDQDMGADLVEVPHVAGRVLEIPVHLAGIGIPGDRTVGVEIVAGTVVRIEHRHRVAGAPDGLVGLHVIGAGDPDRAPPVCQALLASFQVSLPGSPGAGTVYFNQTLLPVAASSAAIQSRTPAPLLAAPTMILSLMARGAVVMSTLAISGNVVSHAILPVSLLVAMTRPGLLAAVMTRLPHKAAPRFWRCCSCFGSMRQMMRPASPEVPSIL